MRLLLPLLLAAPALAQDTYDLRETYSPSPTDALMVEHDYDWSTTSSDPKTDDVRSTQHSYRSLRYSTSDTDLTDAGLTAETRTYHQAELRLQGEDPWVLDAPLTARFDATQDPPTLTPLDTPLPPHARHLAAARLRPADLLPGDPIPDDELGEIPYPNYLPERPVAVGDTWDLDLDAFAFGHVDLDQLDRTIAFAHGTLESVTEQDGIRIYRLTFTVEFSGLTPDFPSHYFERRTLTLEHSPDSPHLLFDERRKVISVRHFDGLDAPPTDRLTTDVHHRLHVEPR